MGRVAAALAVGFALSAGLGFWAGRNAGPASNRAASDSSDLASCERARSKLESLAALDLEDYLRIKTLEARYRKADELLGKMMLVLLADLGLRASSAQAEYSRAAARGQSEMPARESQPGRGDPVPAVLPNPQPERARSDPTPPAETSADKDWHRAERGRHERDPREQLKRLAIPDFGRAFVEAHTPRRVDPFFFGCFDGEAKLPDRHWLIAMAIQPMDRGSRGELQASLSFSITVAGEPKPFSVFNRAGPLQDLKAPNGSEAYLIRASDRAYLQLYRTLGQPFPPDLLPESWPQGNQKPDLMANVYEGEADGRFRLLGPAFLRKVSCSR